MNWFIRQSISVCFLLLGGAALLAQSTVRDSATTGIMMINIEYNGSMAGGDMADRFGFTSAIGGGIGYKFTSNLYLTAGARYLFGGTVKENDILASITTAGGMIVIADNGNLAEVRMQERGWVLPFAIGKIFPINPANQNSGLYLEIGGQFIEHRIYFVMPDLEPASLSKEHRKGYDRLTNGLGLRQGAGYRFFDKRNYVNFAIGLELSQNFTRSRRSINTWTLPIYAKSGRRIYYN
jgi:hypothetical protein